MFKYTEKKLARDIEKAAKKINPDFRSVYLPENREVNLSLPGEDDSETRTFFLGNLFLKFSKMSRIERRGSIESYLRDSLIDKELSPDEWMASLALQVRTKFEIEHRNRHIELKRKPPQSILFERGQLVVEVVTDSTETMAITQVDDLVKMGVTREEAIRIATAAIRRSTHPDQWENVGESIWVSSYQDDYDFARLVIADEDLRFPFAGTPIVFSPSRSICLATDSANADVLSKMIDAGNQASSSHRLFSQLLWTRGDDNHWEHWKPDETSDASQLVALQVVRETLTQYEETKKYLERSITDDVFIASYTAIENDHGITCYSVYTLDLPSYLPRTDLVMIVDPERPEGESVIGQLDWSQFESCCEDLLVIHDITPAWYRILNPLGSAQKKRMRQLVRPHN